MRDWLAARRRRSGPLIALAVAAAYGPAKEWPVARYAALIDRLAERHGAECVLVGAPGERAALRAVAAASRAGALVAAGETSIGQALALLSLCDGFAGNDSGSMHVAAALGIPDRRHLRLHQPAAHRPARPAHARRSTTASSAAPASSAPAASATTTACSGRRSTRWRQALVELGAVATAVADGVSASVR